MRSALALALWILAAPAAAAPPVDPSCLCGDADDDGAVAAADAAAIQQRLAGLIADVPAPDKCEVTASGGCGLLDAVVIARDAAGQDPFTQQLCTVAATSACQDAASALIDAGNAATFVTGGPDAIGGVGDLGLANGRLRAVIDAPGIDPTSFGGVFPLANVGAHSGGTLVDLAVAGADNDQWVQQTQAVVGRRSLFTGFDGETDAANRTLIDVNATFATDGVEAGDQVNLSSGPNAGLALRVAALLGETALLLVVPPGTPFVDDFSESISYSIFSETGLYANEVVYDTAELLDDQDLPVSSHSGDVVRLRLTGGVLVLDPADLPQGASQDPVTGRMHTGGSPIDVETTYTLATGSRALEVETRLTNPTDAVTGLVLSGLRDRVRTGGLGGGNVAPWSAFSGALVEGTDTFRVVPFAALSGRTQPGASYAMVDVEAGQLLHAADGAYLAIQTQMSPSTTLFSGESLVWRRAIAVGEANDAGAVDEAVRRLAASTDRLTSSGTTMPNPYGATATLSGTVAGATEQTRVVAYQQSPALLFDPGPPTGSTSDPGFYPSFFLNGLVAPPIGFAVPDPVSGAYQLTVPTGFPGLVGSGPGELVVPPGLEGGIPDSAYRVEVETPGLAPLSAIAEVTAGGSAVLDFDLAPDASLGRLDLEVTDGLGGPLPARVVVQGVDPDGAGPLPPTPDPDFGDLPRAAGRANVAHLVEGTGSVYVPPGAYRVLATRGLEYSVDRFPQPGALDFVLVAAGQTLNVDLVLERLLDSATLPDGGGSFVSPLRRFVSADLSVRADASWDAAVPPEDRVAGHLASGVEVMVSAEYDILADLAPAISVLDAAHAIDVASLIATRTGVSATGGTPVAVPGVLELPNTAGSFGAWPLVPDPEAPRRGASADEYRWPAELFEQLRAAGATVVSLQTPRFPIAGPPLPPIGRGHFSNGKAGFSQTNVGFSSLIAGGYAIPVQSADGSLADLTAPRTVASTSNLDFDVMEVDSGFTFAYDLQRLDWYALTSAGLVRTAVAGSGLHDLVDAAGFPRTFVFAPGNASNDLSSLDLAAFDEALLPRLVQPTPGVNLSASPRPGAGPDDMEVLVSSGPVVYLEVDVAQDGTFEGQPGDLIPGDMTGVVDVRVTVLAAPWVPVDVVRIVINGYDPGVPVGVTGFAAAEVDLSSFLAPTPQDPFSSDPMDVVRLRGVFSVSLPAGEYWLAAEARGALEVDGVYLDVVAPGGNPLLDQATGFTNPVFIDGDGDGSFDPPGVL